MDDFTVITQNKSTLGGIDYVVFAALLLFSTCIGLFFAYFDSKKTKDSEFDESGYLVGNRSVSFLFGKVFFVLQGRLFSTKKLAASQFLKWVHQIWKILKIFN